MMALAGAEGLVLDKTGRVSIDTTEGPVEIETGNTLGLKINLPNQYIVHVKHSSSDVQQK